MCPYSTVQQNAFQVRLTALHPAVVSQDTVPEP